MLLINELGEGFFLGATIWLGVFNMKLHVKLTIVLFTIKFLAPCATRDLMLIIYVQRMCSMLYAQCPNMLCTWLMCVCYDFLIFVNLYYLNAYAICFHR